MGQGYNLKFGPIRFDLVGRVGATFSDNINASGANPVSDIVVSTGIDFGGRWDITSLNSISFGVGASFKKYVNHPELDSTNSFLTLTPDSSIEFAVRALGIEFSVYDRIGFSDDPTDSIVVDPETDEPDFDIFQFARFNNSAGIDASFDFNRIELTVGYDREDVIPIEERFKSTDRTKESFNGRSGIRLANPLTLGVHGSYFWNDFEVDFNNDSKGYSVGPFMNLQATDSIQIEAQMGWTNFSFTVDGRNGDTSDSDRANFSVNVSHTANRWYFHSIKYSRTTNFGFISNTTTVDDLNYGFRMDALKNIRLTGNLGFQDGSDSGGTIPETFDRFTFQISLESSLSSRLSWYARYFYSKKDSNIDVRSFTQNSVSIGIGYDF